MRIAPAIFVFAILITASAVLTSSKDKSLLSLLRNIFLISSIETLLLSEIIFDIFNLPKRRLASEIVGIVPPFP